MIPCRKVHVTAPSRLHFGLLAFGHSKGRQFGGIGVMIDKPGVVVQVSSAPAFSTVNDPEKRVHATADTWRESVWQSDLPACEIEVVAAPALHTGLGVGTQLALAVAVALDVFDDREPCEIEELAIRIGRGVRSAVGTYGFQYGGLIAELGKLPGEEIAPLYEHVVMPEDWRFVLVSPDRDAGLSGDSEQEAFSKLPPVPAGVTEQLTEAISEQLLPAAREADFDRFSRALYEYGNLAGRCFEKIQGGAYNGPRAEQLVQQIRELEVCGVGQSSWGPTIFALCRSDSDALQLRNELLNAGHAAPEEVIITSPSPSGARVTVEP